MRANLKGMEQATQPVPIPQSAAAAAAGAPVYGGGAVKAGSPPQGQAASAAMMNAFRVQLDYAQIKSKLRPTNNCHYDAELAEHEAQRLQYAQQQQYLHLLQQQQQQQQALPTQQLAQQSSPRQQPLPAANPLLNWELE